MGNPEKSTPTHESVDASSREAALAVRRTPDGYFRIAFGNAELPLNLRDQKEARGVSKFVEALAVAKSTCLSIAEHRVNCRIYAEWSGNGGMGSSSVRIDDDGLLPENVASKIATGKDSEPAPTSDFLNRTFSTDRSFGDGYAIRKILGNPGNEQTVRLLEASAANTGKSFAQIIAEFADALPAKPFPSTGAKAK